MRRFLFAVLLCTSVAAFAQTPARQVAFTIDDLPKAGAAADIATVRAMTGRLLGPLKTYHVPAIGFVNEKKMEGTEADAWKNVLRMWLAGGFELGNHTYSHRRFYGVTVADMKAETLRGEFVLKPLLAEYNMKPRYFRHPTLSTGRTLEDKEAFEGFLTEHGYRVAPVTIDNMDWLFAAQYEKAKTRGDNATADRIRQEYVPYMGRVFEFYEGLSRQVVGREIPQVLLIHASLLNADSMVDLIAMLQKRGYRFVTLDEALSDPAYKLPDTYIGPVGISWLQRWNITKGNKLVPEPELPEYMKQFDDPAASGSTFKTGAAASR